MTQHGETYEREVAFWSNIDSEWLKNTLLSIRCFNHTTFSLAYW